MLFRSGGSISVTGTTTANLSGTSLSALKASNGSGGTLTINGGDVSIGAATGRTLLLAGTDAALKDAETAAKAPQLTLLDGGTGSSKTPAISVKGGDGKTVQIFSGDGSNNGITTLRGATSVEANKGAITLTAPTTTLSGGSLKADGGSINVSGSTAVNLAATSLSAVKGTSSSGGTIAINGGDVSIGAATGRTLLLAGSGGLDDTNSDPSKHESKLANLTLLDGGTDSSSTPAISVNGGADKTVQIFSGNGSNNGITTLRGATTVASGTQLTADGGQIGRAHV